MWLATPKYHHQFLDLHAIHASDHDSCMSSSDSSELSSGFVSDHDDAVDGLHIGTDAGLEIMARQLPVTLQSIRNVCKVRQHKKGKQPITGAEPV